MVNKIIIKEKERQEEYLKELDAKKLCLKIKQITPSSNEFFYYKINIHKQSLINLKKYMEERLKVIEELLGTLPNVTYSEDENIWKIKNCIVLGEINQLVEDISELTKMINKYNDKS